MSNVNLFPSTASTDSETAESVGAVDRVGEPLTKLNKVELPETNVKLTEAEINALLILVNTELDADDRIFKLSELNAIRNKLLKASENFDLPFLLW